MNTLRRTSTGLVACALLLSVGACTKDAERPTPTPPAGSSASAAPDLRAASVTALSKLPAVDVTTLPTPTPPDGLAKSSIEGYAGQLRALLASSLTDETWWTAEPTIATARRFLADVAPQTREQYLSSVDDRNGTHPAAQYLVSIFDADHQPSTPPHIVKAAWRTERVTHDDGSATLRVALEAYALYRVAPDDEPVIVRRWFQLTGDPSVTGSWPSLANYTLIDGIDSCTLYDEGTYEPTRGGRSDATAFAAILKQATTRGWVPFGLSDAKDETPSDKRSDACKDRTNS